MLKISKHSWHYRLWKLGREDYSQPHNLCKYFWHIALIKLLIPLTLVSGFLFGLGALVWVIWGHPAETAVITVTALLTIVAIVGFIKAIATMLERRHAKRAFEDWSGTPKKEPGVIRAFLKARKQKVCPLIEVVDD